MKTFNIIEIYAVRRTIPQYNLIMKLHHLGSVDQVSAQTVEIYPTYLVLNIFIVSNVYTTLL